MSELAIIRKKILVPSVQQDCINKISFLFSHICSPSLTLLFFTLFSLLSFLSTLVQPSKVILPGHFSVVRCLLLCYITTNFHLISFWYLDSKTDLWEGRSIEQIGSIQHSKKKKRDDMIWWYHESIKQ